MFAWESSSARVSGSKSSPSSSTLVAATIAVIVPWSIVDVFGVRALSRAS